MAKLATNRISILKKRYKYLMLVFKLRLPYNYHNSRKNKVVNRSVTPILLWGRGSAGRAPRSQRGGRGFESHRLHHVFNSSLWCVCDFTHKFAASASLCFQNGLANLCFHKGFNELYRRSSLSRLLLFITIYI